MMDDKGPYLPTFPKWPIEATDEFCLSTDIVNCDLKSTLRVLYNLFTKYRNVE